jgi:guanylate kinase
MSSEREAKDGGTLFVVSAPSGAGKTTLVKALTERDASVAISVSHTTRPRRRGERNGIDYHFVDVPHFQRLIEADAFLEHACVFGHLYGTSKESVHRELDAVRDVVLEIDWQGARQIRNRVPDAVSIFVVPPSRDSLRKRLEARGQDSFGVIERRMRNVVADLSHFDEFDYLIVNDSIERAADDLASIVRARRLSSARQIRSHRRLIDDLLDAPHS